MDRRSFLKASGAFALAGAPMPARGGSRADSGPAPVASAANGLRLSVTWGMMGKMPVAEGLAALERWGYNGFEMFDWRDPDLLSSFAAEKNRHSLACACLTANKGVTAPGCGLVNPREREGFLQEIALAVEAARKVGAKRLVVLTGNELGGMPRSLQMQNVVASLRAAAPVLEKNGITAVVEILNTYVNHSGYFLYYVADGVEIVDRVGSSNVKLLFDAYHVQIMEGNLVEKIRSFIDYIGHFHVGDVPGRNEPGTGEINYRFLFRSIYDLGDRYQGYVGLEYRPKAPLQENLPAMRRLADFG